MDRWYDSIGGIVAIIVGGFIALILVIGIPSYVISYEVDQGRCNTWGMATNRQTKFVHLNEVVGIPLTWDCFTPDEGGRWIPTSRVRDID